MTITKRDGREVDFNADKIIAAICAAMEETELGVDIGLAQTIAQKIGAAGTAKTVEDVQDAVERLLMDSERKEVAKAYILYRAERTKQRNMKNKMMRDVIAKTTGSVIDNANANVDEHAFGGRKNEAASVIQKTIALDTMMHPSVAKAHKEGLIYQHDLDSYPLGMHNCLFLDFERLFKNGFSTRNGDVRPPTSFSTACQLVAVAFQVQSQDQFGFPR